MDTGHHLKQLPGHMGPRALAARRHIDFAGVGFGVGDELRNARGRNGWVNYHDARLAANARDRGNIADEIVVELLKECRVGRIRRPNNKEERIAIRACLHHCLRPDIAGAAGTILDDEWLPELPDSL